MFVAIFVCLSALALALTVQQQSISTKLYTQVLAGPAKNWLGFQGRGVKGQGRAAATAEIS